MSATQVDTSNTDYPHSAVITTQKLSRLRGHAILNLSDTARSITSSVRFSTVLASAVTSNLPADIKYQDRLAQFDFKNSNDRDRFAVIVTLEGHRVSCPIQT